MQLEAFTLRRALGVLAGLAVAVSAYIFFESQKAKNIERAKYGADGPRIAALRGRAAEDMCNLAVARELTYLLLTHEQTAEAAFAQHLAASQCPFDAEVVEQAARLWRQSGELEKALELSETLVKELPHDAAGYSVRAGVYSDMGRTRDAISDYRQVFELEKGNVEAGRALAHALERDQEACAAATVLEQMLAMNQPDDSEWLWARARRLRKSGQCPRERVDGNRAVIPFVAESDVMLVDVTVNNRLPAKLVFDTGASAVTLTRDFALRLGIALEDGEPYYVSTAGGAAIAYRIVLDEVRLGGARVKRVGAAIVPNMSLGSEVDGLLGNTFLAHFRVNVDSSAKEIVLSTLE